MGDKRADDRVFLGHRVKCHDRYVFRDVRGTVTVSAVVPPPIAHKPEALRILADWLERGIADAKIVNVFRRRLNDEKHCTECGARVQRLGPIRTQ